MSLGRRAVLVLPLLVATIGNAIPYGLSGSLSGSHGITAFEWALSACYAAAAVLLLAYLLGWLSRLAWTLSAACWGASVGHAAVLQHAISRERIALALIFAGYCLRAILTITENDRQTAPEASGVRDH